MSIINGFNGKDDLKDYSDDELSLRVFNDEYLYNRRRPTKGFIEELSERFDFTNEQEEILLNDLLDEE